MDIPQLAAETMKSLEPFLPYLVEGGKIAAKAALETVGKKFSEAAWHKAEALWGQVKPGVEAAPEAEKALKYYLEHPSDEDAYPALRLQVKKLLLENPSLAANLGQVINASGGSIGIGGNVSGNVLNQSNGNTVIQAEHYHAAPQPAPDPTPEELTRAYLQSLVQDCEKLPLGTIHVTFEEAEHDASISLEDVYIDLEVRPRPRGEHGQKYMLMEEREPQRIPILEALADQALRRVVLLGEAGSGKTTCVHYLTIALASIQQNLAAKKPLPEDSELARYFPIRLVLRDVAAGHIPADVNQGGVDILWNALRADLARKIGAEPASLLFPHLQKRIQTTPCLIMLDGLDEVPESEQRRPRLLEAIQHFAAPLTHSIVLVTARPYAYDNPKWRLPHFETLDLLAFSDEQIENFISRFYDSVRIVKNWDEDLAETLKSDLNEAVQGREYLRKLAERPLLLTLIASVNSSGKKLPDDRAELYNQTTDLMLQRWQRRKENSLAENEIVRFFSTDAGRVIDILERLAYKVHERQGRDRNRKADAPADIERDEVWGAFSAALSDKVNIHELLHFLEKRAGLLLDRGEGVYVFPHRSFQEYLAAGFLNKQADEKYHLDQVFRSEPQWWREVVLLGIARMSSASLRNAADEVDALVPCDPSELERELTPADWLAAALAGQALLEMRLKEKGGEQVKYKLLLKRAAHWLAQLLEQGALTPRERAEAGNTLARLGDPRQGVINDFLFCHIPAGRFMMGEGKEQFPHEIKQEFYMTRYPITNAQFDLFVNDENGYKNDKWWTKAGLDWRKDRRKPDKYGGVFDLPNHPVVYVRWYEAHAFTRWATKNVERLTFNVWKNGKIEPLHLENGKFEMRLPNEAEWEYAARAGTQTPYSWGDNITPNHANYNETGLGATSAVGAFPAGMNSYGLLDMSGNVWEWCATAWQENYKDYLKNEEKLNKPEGNVARVLRGGSCDYEGSNLRCAIRYYSPNGRDDVIGFRVVVCAASPISP